MKLIIPTTGYYKISKTGEEWTPSETFSRSIEIGSLRPETEAVILLWPESYFAPIFAEKDAKINYTDGVSDIEFPIAVTGTSAWIENHKYIILLLTFYLVFIPAILYLHRKVDELKRRKFKVVTKVETKKEIPIETENKPVGLDEPEPSSKVQTSRIRKSPMEDFLD